MARYTEALCLKPHGRTGPRSALNKVTFVVRCPAAIERFFCALHRVNMDGHKPISRLPDLILASGAACNLGVLLSFYT